MGTIRLNTITDFVRRGYMVRVRCRSCGHNEQLNPRRLMNMLGKMGSSLRNRDVERQMRCCACKARNAEIMPGTLYEE